MLCCASLHRIAPQGTPVHFPVKGCLPLNVVRVTPGPVRHGLPRVDRRGRSDSDPRPGSAPPIALPAPGSRAMAPAWGGLCVLWLERPWGDTALESTSPPPLARLTTPAVGGGDSTQALWSRRHQKLPMPSFIKKCSVLGYSHSIGIALMGRGVSRKIVGEKYEVWQEPQSGGSWLGQRHHQTGVQKSRRKWTTKLEFSKIIFFLAMCLKSAILNEHPKSCQKVHQLRCPGWGWGMPTHAVWHTVRTVHTVC